MADKEEYQVGPLEIEIMALIENLRSMKQHIAASQQGHYLHAAPVNKLS